MGDVVEALDRAPVHSYMFIKPRDMPTALEYFINHAGSLYLLPKEHNADFNLAYLSALGIDAEDEPKTVYDNVRKVTPDQAATASDRVFEQFKQVLKLVDPSVGLSDSDDLDEAPRTQAGPGASSPRM
jgi:hypothetical protein